MCPPPVRTHTLRARAAARLSTSLTPRGRLTCRRRLYVTHAPKTCRNFIEARRRCRRVQSPSVDRRWLMRTQPAAGAYASHRHAPTAVQAGVLQRHRVRARACGARAAMLAAMPCFACVCLCCASAQHAPRCTGAQLPSNHTGLHDSGARRCWRHVQQAQSSDAHCSSCHREGTPRARGGAAKAFTGRSSRTRSHGCASRCAACGPGDNVPRCSLQP